MSRGNQDLISACLRMPRLSVKFQKRAKKLTSISKTQVPEQNLIRRRFSLLITLKQTITSSRSFSKRVTDKPVENNPI